MHSDTDIPYKEPVELEQGNTLEWKRDLSAHYAPATWTLTYFLRGPVNADIAATADGTDYAVTVSSATTANWTPGRYKLFGYVSASGERNKVYEGYLDVLENPANYQEGEDFRSWARKCRDALRLAVEGQQDGFIVNFHIAAAGRTIGKMSADERIKWLDYFEAKVLREDEQEKIERGESTGRNILIRFGKIGA